MSNFKSYRVRDAQGNLYGPADLNTLRQWISEGRIVAGMTIAEEGSPDWVDVSTYPGLSDLFGQPTPSVPASPNPYATGTFPAAGHAGYYPPAGPQLNVLGLIAMISGILSIVGCCCYGFVSIPTGIAAIVMATFSLKQFRNQPDRYSGKGMALAGLICGGVGLLLGLAGIAFFIYVVAQKSMR